MKKKDIRRLNKVKKRAETQEAKRLASAGKPETDVKLGKSDLFPRFCKDRLAVFGLVLFIVLALIGMSADLFFDYEQQAILQNMSLRYLKPCAEHPFGCDEFGRDIMIRIIYGARISLYVGIGVLIGSLTIGSIIGSIAAYYGGKVDMVLMRIMDVFLAIPNSLMAICVVAAFGTGIMKLILALSISGVPRFSRIVRSAVLSCKGQEYVEAAKACGTRDLRIIFRHIIPNAIGPIIVQGTTSVARTVLTVSSLSFIGLGIAAPTPEWGSMLSTGRAAMRYYPHIVIFPGLAIMAEALSLYCIGDGLRDAMDPRLRN